MVVSALVSYEIGVYYDLKRFLNQRLNYTIIGLHLFAIWNNIEFLQLVKLLKDVLPTSQQKLTTELNDSFSLTMEVESQKVENPSENLQKLQDLSEKAKESSV